MQNNVPQPLFAPASQSVAQSDDIDFNEIFSEYFANEFDDPLNAYTSSMANYNTAAGPPMPPEAPVAAPPAALQQPAALQEQDAQMGRLPTGGIRTAFHHGAQSSAVAGASQVATAAMVASSAAAAPLAKKPRVDVPTPVALAPVQSAGLAHPGATLLSVQQLQQNHAAAAAAAAGAPAMQPVAAAGVNGNSAGRVPLPVGVGIRLGGVGGIAPATAQSSARAPGVAPGQYAGAMWGASGAGAVPDQVAAERRQRNREHAKRSRVRKKFMLESLQEQVIELQRENQRLRMIVQEHIPEKAMQIISENCTEHPLFTDPNDKEAEKSKQEQIMVRSDFSLMRSLATGQKCFVLSDPKLPDNPIVFASPDFYKLTGYSSKEVLGRNCRFLQGPGTDTKSVDVIRKAISTGSDATVCLLNYKADGKPFWNQFFIAALRDSDNCIVNYVGVQTEVEPNTGSTELEDRVNAVLPLQSKEDKTS